MMRLVVSTLTLVCFCCISCLAQKKGSKEAAVEPIQLKKSGRFGRVCSGCGCGQQSEIAQHDGDKSAINQKGV